MKGLLVRILNFSEGFSGKIGMKAGCYVIYVTVG